MLRSTLAALFRETSCSLDAPPNRTATLHLPFSSTVCLTPFARRLRAVHLYAAQYPFYALIRGEGDSDPPQSGV